MIKDIIKPHSRDHEFLDAGVQKIKIKNKNSITLHVSILLTFPNAFVCSLWLIS